MQLRKVLHNGSVFCFLFSSNIAYGTEGEANDETYLTKGIAEWSGVPYNGQLVIYADGSDSTNNLAVANDDNYSFEHIAEMIEKNL